MNVAVVSPEQVLFDGEATQVITRTTEGDVAFLAGHAPFLGTLVECETRVYLADGSVAALRRSAAASSRSAATPCRSSSS